MIHLTDCAIQYNSQIGTYGACSKWDVIGILISISIYTETRGLKCSCSRGALAAWGVGMIPIILEYYPSPTLIDFGSVALHPGAIKSHGLGGSATLGGDK
jgi:hypothetical protein